MCGEKAHFYLRELYEIINDQIVDKFDCDSCGQEMVTLDANQEEKIREVIELPL